MERVEAHRRDEGADAARSGARRVRRVRPRAVVGLELWDHPAGDTDLWRGRARADFPELVGEVARRVLAREGLDRVVLCGGGARAIAGALPNAPIEPDPLFAARAAADLVGEPDLLAIDAGQTSLKRAHRGRETRHERGAGSSPLAPLLRTALAGVRPDAPLLLALPCTLDDQCRPGPCTYSDVAETLAQLERRPGPTFVVNDAELAAFAARRAGLVAPGTSALVLTIGFGVGAAAVRDV